MQVTAYVTHPMNSGGLFWQVFTIPDTSNVVDYIMSRGYIVDKYVENKPTIKRKYSKRAPVYVETSGAHLFNVWNNRVCHHA
jgi:hypothetical protein